MAPERRARLFAILLLLAALVLYARHRLRSSPGKHILHAAAVRRSYARATPKCMMQELAPPPLPPRGQCWADRWSSGRVRRMGRGQCPLYLGRSYGMTRRSCMQRCSRCSLHTSTTRSWCALVPNPPASRSLHKLISTGVERSAAAARRQRTCRTTPGDAAASRGPSASAGARRARSSGRLSWACPAARTCRSRASNMWCAERPCGAC